MNPPITNNDILAVLKNARLFSQFSDEQLEQLISYSTVERFDTRQVILQQGVQNGKFYVMLDGQVSVYTDDEFILRLRRQGDLVGEMSVITKHPTTAKVVADTAVALFSISAENIEQSGRAELKSTVYKLFLDILTQKLTLTTRQVIGFQATTQELTVKKQELAKSEDVIQQKEAILQQVLGSMSDGVVVMERSGGLLHINDAFKTMVGDTEIPDDLNLWPEKLGLYKRDEKTLYTPEQLPMHTIFEGKPVDFEEIMVRHPGLEPGIWLQASSRMLTSETSTEPQGAVVVFRDFTRKKMEEKALIAAKENAEAAAKAKSDFLAVMSHELRTPLNGIMGMTDLIYGTELSDEQRGLLDTLKSSSETLLGLIRNILDYSSLESENQVLSIEPFSLQAVIAEIGSTYAAHARNKGIQLEMHLSPDVPEQMLGNTRGILQIIRNLADNALKFTETGSVSITAELNNRLGNTAQICISVTDTGIGIEQNRLNELFQPFSQADGSYSRSFDGAGIGLSLCKKYVDCMNGEITVHSEKGKGTRFEVYLDLEIANNTVPSASNAHIARPDESTDETFSRKYPLHILVAEDNTLNQKLISKVLEKLGYIPEIVSNGAEAVERNRAAQFDLILMDLQMPEMDGLAASHIISRERNEAKRPWIVALTANVSEEVKQSCFNAGMVDYLTKPLKINHLITLLQNLH